MQRLLVHAGAWIAATGTAVTLSWFGVDAVLKGTVYDAPRAVPVSGTPSWPDPDAAMLPEPDTSSTQRPPPSEPAEHADTDAAEPSAEPTEDSSMSAPSEAGMGSIRSVSVDGGRVVFDMGPDAAALVSATPEQGWDMRVWKQAGWIRVTFSSEGRSLSVFALWHDSQPRIELYEE